MKSRTLDYGAIKLRDALKRIKQASTPQEGLYAAYLEDLQWLDDLEDLPGDLGECLRRLNCELTRVPAPDVAASARATISKLNPDEGAALAKLMADLLRRLESIGDGQDKSLSN